MFNSKVASRLKAQLSKFSRELSEGLPRPSRKFVQQSSMASRPART